VALVQEHRDLSFERFQTLLALTRQRLDSPEAEISVTCIYFVEKKAPVSGEKSIMDYELTLRGISSDQGNRLWLSVKVPVTSLCPCSKKISDYGAHNQRSYIEITVEPGQVIDPKTLIEIAESEASAELYAILKRPDEKAVTERAYDNPKFVEDLIRDVAGRLRQLSQINAFEVRVENFESIHNHSAVAFLTYTKVANP
jgi:GTP cyclohydrolase I